MKMSKSSIEKRIEEKKSISEKKEEIKKDVLTPPEREVLKEEEKEAPYIYPPPYKSKIPFP